MKFLESNGIKQLLRKIFFWCKKTWIGTTAEWQALSEDEKNKYDIAHITDDRGTGYTIVDTVEEGNMNLVTSNAVAAFREALPAINPNTTEVLLDGTDPSQRIPIDNWVCPADGLYYITVSPIARIDETAWGYNTIFVTDATNKYRRMVFRQVCPRVDASGSNVWTFTAYVKAGDHFISEIRDSAGLLHGKRIDLFYITRVPFTI